MNKLDMAHECAMKLVGNPTTPLKDIKSIVSASWQYADLMQAEADKSEQEQAIKDAESSKQLFDSLTKKPNGECAHFHTTLNHTEFFDCGKVLKMADSPQLESILHEIDCYLDKTDNTEKDANKLIQSIYVQLSGEVLNDDWQPDWSVAPDWANWWCFSDTHGALWFSREPQYAKCAWLILNDVKFDGCLFDEAPSFNYQGDRKQSLRKRPHEA